MGLQAACLAVVSTNSFGCKRRSDMDMLRPWAFRIVVLIAMLGAIGGWEIYRGTVMTGQASVADHLKCYRILPLTQVNLKVRLTGEFGQEEVTVRGNRLLCVPVTKEVLGPDSGGGDEE
jgi:hypothetical protein